MKVCQMALGVFGAFLPENSTLNLLGRRVLRKIEKALPFLLMRSSHLQLQRDSYCSFILLGPPKILPLNSINYALGQCILHLSFRKVDQTDPDEESFFSKHSTIFQIRSFVERNSKCLNPYWSPFVTIAYHIRPVEKFTQERRAIEFNKGPTLVRS